MFKTMLFLLAVLFLAISPAEARVDMVPHIVVMEPRERSDEVTILNLSDETREFTVKIIHYKQTLPKGTYEKLSEPLNPLFDPDKIVRFSPKTFTLGPDGQQKVRFSLRKPADLPDGEYRFHVLATSYATEIEKQPSSQDVAVVMSMNVGIAIPIVIRHGELTATGKLSDFELKAPSKENGNKPELHFLGTREGNSSTLGRISVEWSEDGRNFKEIGFIRGFNIFTELNTRQGRVPLNMLPTTGTLRVIYNDEKTNTVYDEIIFDL